MINNTSNQKSLVGVVSQVTFTNDFFNVLDVNIISTNFPWNSSTITVVGNTGIINEGRVYKFQGKIINNYRYGKQFAANQCSPQ